MRKYELASAVTAAGLPRSFTWRPGLRVARVLRKARRSEGLTLPLVVVALASALGGAMPLLVYGTGPQPIAESARLLQRESSAESAARPNVASVAGAQTKSGEPRRAERGGSAAWSDSESPAPSAPVATNRSALLAGDAVADRHSPPASSHASGDESSEPAAPPAAGDESTAGEEEAPPAPVPAEEDTDGSTGAEDGSTGAEEKVTLCHKPDADGTGVTITVSANSVAEHLAHGDTLGACADG
jgi:hypothetical protein